MIADKKYVLCRPLGGLNDNLCQIYKCIAYCIKYNRTLILEKVWGDLFEWRLGLELSDYANKSLRVIDMSAELFDKIRTFSCVPAQLQGNWLTYKVYRHIDLRTVCLNGTNSLVSFDFEKDYDERVLIHHQSGGGGVGLSYEAVKYFRVTAEISAEIGRLRRQLDQYAAIHIRNTDYTSDYDAFLVKSIAALKGQKTLVCSDDFAAKEKAQKLFGDSYISIVDLPNTSRKKIGLHVNTDNSPQFVVKTALLELIMLAYSHIFLKCPILRNYYSDKWTPAYSGFARLAHQNRAPAAG